MRLTFTEAQWRQEGGAFWVALKVEDPYEARRWFMSIKQGVKYVAELKRWRKLRSLDANAYFWQLLDKMADAKSSMEKELCTKEELYLDYVRKIGPFKDFTMTEDEAKTFRVAWSRLGTGWPTEQVDFAPDGDRVVIRAYYGSSTYSKKRMSRLIDMAVQDAKALGIETMTPEELERLMEGWS